MDWWKLRLRCERAVDSLDLPPGVRDPTDLCNLVGERRDRPVVLVPRTASPRQACAGLIIPGDDRDFIIVDRHATAQPHRLHLVAHQLGHLILEHEPLTGTGEDEQLAVEQRFSREGVPDEPVRSVYAASDEAEAEMFASVLGERVSFPSTAGGPPTAADIQRRPRPRALAILEPLRQHLHDVRPGADYATEGGSGDRPTAAEAQLYRSFIAIHDSWLQLRDFLDEGVAERARAAIAEEGIEEGVGAAIVDATQLTCAIEAARYSTVGVPRYLRASKAATRKDDFERELAYLQLVAAAYAGSPLVAALAAECRVDRQAR